MVEGERVRTTRANPGRREQDSRLPLPGTLLTRKMEGTDAAGGSPRSGLPLREPALLVPQRGYGCGHRYTLERPRLLRADTPRGPTAEGADRWRKITGPGSFRSPPRARLRCAIYTRKSTEEGLDQDFSSRDAQREAAEAFVQSQRREGWIALPGLYDDGGFTGPRMQTTAPVLCLHAGRGGRRPSCLQ
jgi:hypothetical protein